MPKNSKVDAVLNKARQWQAEMEKLRAILLESPLEEELKWGWPCYTLDGKNIVLIHGFNEYCALLFFKGALMSDPRGILIQQTENVQAARHFRFTSLQEIVAQEPIIKEYVEEAIQVEKAGLKMEPKKTEEFPVPDEFQQKLSELPALQTAFQALTPGRQRGYLLYFAAPKQSKTRESRIEKYIPQILEGKGLRD